MIGPGSELFPRGTKKPPTHKPLDHLSILREWWIANRRSLRGAPKEMLKLAQTYSIQRKAILKALLSNASIGTKGRINCQLKLLTSWCTQIDEELNQR